MNRTLAIHEAADGGETHLGRWWVRFAVSTAVGIVLVVALAIWSGISATEIVATLKLLSPRTFGAALALHALIYVARAERFRLLLPAAARPPRVGLLSVTSAHNLAVYVLPAKSGEATLPLYLGRTFGVGAADGLASLIVSRLFDLAALLACMALVTLCVACGEHWRAPMWTAVALTLALAFAAALSLALTSRSELLLCPLLSLARLTGFARTAPGRRLEHHASALQDALRVAGHGRLRAGALALSFAVWLLIFAFYGVLAQGFGLPEGVGFLHAAFGSSAAVLMNLLPVNSLAGFGTQEAGWVLGFRMVGVAPEAALPGGVGVHLVQLFDTVLFGVVGHAWMGLVRRK
jgi:uncharacterized membrane protein YbhN (UPF0104 family)